MIRAKIINIETRQFPWEKKSHAAGMRIPLIGGGLAAPASSGGRMAAPAASTGGGFAPASSSGSPGYGFPRPQVIKATISRVYKGYKVVNASKGETVEIEYSSPYRMPLKSGRLYLLTGYNVDGKLYTSMCNWYSLWRDVTVTQKFGLKFYYWIYCACKIQFCPDGRCIRNRRLCTWDLRRFDIGAAKRDCHSQFNICMVKPSIGRCLWISPKGGKRCEKTSKPLIKPSKPVIP